MMRNKKNENNQQIRINESFIKCKFLLLSVKRRELIQTKNLF
jgi:hypothetical protein